MKIKEFILDNTLKGAQWRMDKLVELNAPAIMLEAQQKLLDELKEGKIRISGDKELLDDEFEGFKVRTGRGGKEYIVINGNINYFPNSRYGKYIKKAE